MRSEVISRSLEPLDPLVQMTYVISQPFAAQRAEVPPAPISASSGCAQTTMARAGISVITVRSEFDVSVPTISIDPEVTPPIRCLNLKS